MKNTYIELNESLPGGRRELRLDMGDISVSVLEVPGRSLNGAEWKDLQRARRSYAAMWGNDILAADPFDGREPSPYDTSHYLARVRDGSGSPRLLTMRRVRVAPARLTRELRANPLPVLPVDVRLWRVRTATGSMPLWVPLRTRARALAPRNPVAEFRIAALSRTGTYPYGGRGRGERERELTGIAFAAMQLLVTLGDDSLLYVCSLCPEFQDRVLGVTDVTGTYVPPDFTRTEDVLGLPRGAVQLDTSLEMVRRYKIALPGYFIDPGDAAAIIRELLDAGRIALDDLAPSVLRMVRDEMAFGGHPREHEDLAPVASLDHGRLARTLTRPRLFKYLVPLLEGDRPLAGMSVAELRARLIDGTRGRPFSATMRPKAWADRARAILEAAAAKYARPAEAPVAR